MGKASAFMKLSKEVSRGLKKAKNAPARKYADNPKGKAPAPAKGLPDKGMMGAKEPPKLNPGAQAAKDLKAKKVATKTERVSSPTLRRQAVNAGVATRAEAVGNATMARKARNASHRGAGTLKNKPAPKKPMTTAQKVVGGTALAVGGTAAIMINDKKSMPKARASNPRGGTPMKGYGKAAAPRGGKPMAGSKASPATSKPAPMQSFGSPTKTSTKGFTIPATPVASKPAAPKATVKDLTPSISISSTPLSPAKAQKPDKQVGGLFGRTDGKWHLRRKVGRG